VGLGLLAVVVVKWLADDMQLDLFARQALDVAPEEETV
jgi:hypothetical protein